MSTVWWLTVLWLTASASFVFGYVIAVRLLDQRRRRCDIDLTGHRRIGT